MGFRACTLGAFALVAAGAAVTSGCYVETAEDRNAQTGRESPRRDDPALTGGGEVGECRTSLTKGCFDGHVLSKKEFLVEGRQFFNADDLANRFKELITVQGDQAALGAEDFEVILETQLGNQSFAQGFEYYMTGETMRSDKVQGNGNFSVHELPEGSYDLRVQKSVKFTLKRTVTVAAAPQPVLRDGEDPAREPEQPAEPQTRTQTITKAFCATIYSDASLDVRRGERQHDIFDSFRLYVTDDACTGPSRGTTLTIDP